MPELTTRKHEREQVSFNALVQWDGAPGRLRSAPFIICDLSPAGAALVGDVPIDVGKEVLLEVARRGIPTGAVVRYCIESGQKFRIGLEFSDLSAEEVPTAEEQLDYYEILQLSPNAEAETINRVYRIIAGRFHPDNTETGDVEKFLRLSQAFAVLSDAEKRAAYDAARASRGPQPLPLFQAREFVDDKVGEGNRRLGVLCLLYAQRRRNFDQPFLSLLQLEEMMSYPREYLEFTLWYLRQKNYVERDQGASYLITAEGVDYVEEHTPTNPGLHKLLTQASQARKSPDGQSAAQTSV